MLDDSSTQAWNEVADDWVAHADTNDYRLHYLMPRLLALAGNVDGKIVLDLGCGEGGYARELARRGAHVLGIDGSARLIEIARERARAEGLDITFEHANASALDQIAPGQIDVVVAAMSLMDVEDYEAAVREVARVSRAGGALAMSILHPCFSAPVSQWMREEDGALHAFAVDHYFDRAVWPERITPRFRATVLRRHRPLEDYMRSLLASGLRLDVFKESDVTPEELRRSHRFRKLARIPYFLFMRWTKT